MLQSRHKKNQRTPSPHYPRYSTPTLSLPVFRREIRTRFLSPTECHLGQWYEGQTKEKFARTRTYAKRIVPARSDEAAVKKLYR